MSKLTLTSVNSENKEGEFKIRVVSDLPLDGNILFTADGSIIGSVAVRGKKDYTIRFRGISGEIKTIKANAMDASGNVVSSGTYEVNGDILPSEVRSIKQDVGVSVCPYGSYTYDPSLVYSRMINPNQLKSMLDSDNAKKMVLAAVPFWPKDAVLWSVLDPSLGPPPSYVDYKTYIQYTTAGKNPRTYQSIQFDWRSDLADITLPLRYYDLPKLGAFEQTMRNKGLAKKSVIVLYDDTIAAGANGTIVPAHNALNRLAIRAHFVLQYYGHENVYFLNGGDQEWFKSNFSGASVNASHALWNEGPLYSTSPAPVNPSPSNYSINTELTSRVILRDGVVAERTNPCSVVLDARPYSMYVGTQPGGLVQCQGLQKVRRLGHIAGAVNAPWATYLVTVTGANGVKYTKLKSTEELSSIMVSSGTLVGSKKVVTACNEGIHAVMAWFVIYHLLGHHDSTVYEGSTAEWADGNGVYVNYGGSYTEVPQGIERYPMLSGLEDQ